MDETPEDMVGYQVHLSDVYAVTWGNQRASSYGVSGIPDSWFDGVLRRVGGSTATYPAYVALVNARLAAACDTTVAVGAVETSASTYDVTATIGIEAGGADKNMIVHIIQVLDYYPASTDDRYRNCLIQHYEESLALAAGASADVTASFTLTGASAADPENVKFIAWAQTPGTSGAREVFQADQIAYPFTVPIDGDLDGDGDVDLADLATLLAAYDTCDGDPLYDPIADINSDGCVDLADLATLLANYGIGT